MGKGGSDKLLHGFVFLCDQDKGKYWEIWRQSGKCFLSFSLSLCLKARIDFPCEKQGIIFIACLTFFSNLKNYEKGWSQIKLRSNPFPVLSQAKKTSLSFVLFLCDSFVGKTKISFPLRPLPHCFLLEYPSGTFTFHLTNSWWPSWLRCHLI